MGIEFLFAQFVEMYGKPNAKLVPANHLEDVFAEGAGFAGFATGELGQGPHDPDIAAMPDPASFTPVPGSPRSPGSRVTSSSRASRGPTARGPS